MSRVKPEQVFGSQKKPKNDEPKKNFEIPSVDKKELVHLKRRSPVRPRKEIID
jgi:hypothetical protein